MPPVVGAIIGYTTNYVAIRMLFRPLHAWRIFGLRIPFTPGIIPARRHELAARMGQTVGRHLVTAKDAGKALERETFQAELRTAVQDKLESFLETDYGTLHSLLPENPPWSKDLENVGTRVLEDIMLGYLDSDAFEERLRKFLRDKGNDFLARDIDAFLTDRNRENIVQDVRQRIEMALASEDTGQAVGGFINHKLEELLTSPKRVRHILPEETTDVLAVFIRNELPSLLAEVSTLLENPDVRARLTERLRNGIAEVIQSMNGWSGFLAGFVNPDRIDERIPEFLDNASREIADWLSEERTREHIANEVLNRMDGMLDKTVSELIEKVPCEKVEGVKLFLKTEAIAFTQSTVAPELAGAAVNAGLKGIRKRSVRSLLEHTVPHDGIEQVREKLSDQILQALRSESARQALSDMLREEIYCYVHEKKIGKLGERLPDEVKAQLPDLVYRQLLDILRKELPPLMQSLNVERMVEDNVNSLPILEVEGILLTIMRKHFLYINLFGGLLGALIGFLNVFW